MYKMKFALVCNLTRVVSVQIEDSAKKIFDNYVSVAVKVDEYGDRGVDFIAQFFQYLDPVNPNWVIPNPNNRAEDITIPNPLNAYRVFVIDVSYTPKYLPSLLATFLTLC